MRFVSLLVAFCFSLNVMASTGTIQELERAMDDYTYALSVEWDQKDQAFYEAQTKAFFDKMSKMISEDGLSKEEVMKLIELKTKNKASLEALKLKLSVLAKGASTEELVKIVKDASKDLYDQGASWNGSVIIPVAIGIVVVGALAYSIWWSATHECVAYSNQYVCNTYNDCHYYGGGYYSGYYGGGYACYGGSYTTCGYVDVCTQYAKKN